MAPKASLLTWAAAAALGLPSMGLTSPQEASLSQDLIVVQIPVTAAPQLTDSARLTMPLDRYVDGARILRIDPSGGDPVVLTPGFASACDPDVSFDGETIVFAGKRDSDATWQIWTMKADGSAKTQITHRPGQNVAPLFAGARFYLDDPQPTPQIIFAGTANEAGLFALYGTDLEGASLHRLTFNLLSDFSPALLPTGRVVFSSFQRQGAPPEADPGLALLAVNIDGTDLMPFNGNHGAPRYQDMAAVSFDGDRVYFVESDRLSWLGGGDLAYVSWRRPLSSYGRLSGAPEGHGVFHSPTPLPDGGLLASYRSSDRDSVYSLYRVDPQSGVPVEKVFGEAGWHSVDSHVLAPRPPVKGRSNWLKPGSTTGVFYCLDSYRTDPGEGGERSVAPPGAIKHVRVIEGRPNRILGVAPVEEDGSFHIRVPAETPLTFQLLDENRLALRTQRAWSWVMGNENRGCIGCHEDPEMSPPNRMVMAITKPPVDLVSQTSGRRTVDFRHQIAPIVEAHCVSGGCHSPGGTRPILGVLAASRSEASLRTVYQSLLEPPEGRPGRRYVEPGSARSSPLIRLLLGMDSDSRPQMRPPHDGLSQEDRILFIEWVDLGAEFDMRQGENGGLP